MRFFIIRGKTCQIGNFDLFSQMEKHRFQNAAFHSRSLQCISSRFMSRQGQIKIAIGMTYGFKIDAQIQLRSELNKISNSTHCGVDFS